MNSTENERVYLKIYDYETKEFSGLTTYHGLVRIYNSNTWPSRIFWSIVVLSCLSLFMIHSGYLLLGYHLKPTLFQIDTVVPSDGILFPDVSICNLNSLNLSRAQEYNLTTPVLNYLLGFFDDIAKTPNEANLNDHMKYLAYKKNYFLETGHKFNILEVFENISKRCEETIVSCSFGRQQITNCCQYIVTELTELGLCFRIAKERKEHRQQFSGYGFGWELVLNGNNENQEGTIFSDFNAEHGFAIMVHESKKFPRINSNAVLVSPRTTLYTSISMKNITLLDKSNWGSCNIDGNTSESTLKYTANHCEVQCRVKQFLSFCNCVPLAYSARNIIENTEKLCSPVEITTCSHELQKNNVLTSSCICASECNLVEFDLSNSYSNTPEKRTTHKIYTEMQIQRDLSFVSLSFPHVSYERLEQQKQLQTADLLSNIAGSMGLFLGMSTVTLLEIFIYLFKSVWGTVNSTRQKQFMDAVTEEEKSRQHSIVIIQNKHCNDDREKTNMETFFTNEHEQALHRSSIHIHLDRRNSRMLRGGDLFSAPRGSVSIPSQLLSPLSKHNRQSISSGQLGRKASAAGIHSGFHHRDVGSRDYHFKSAVRRSSTLSPVLLEE